MELARGLSRRGLMDRTDNMNGNGEVNRLTMAFQKGSMVGIGARVDRMGLSISSRSTISPEATPLPIRDEAELGRIIKAVANFHERSLEAAMFYEPARPIARIAQPQTESFKGIVSLAVRSFSGRAEGAKAAEGTSGSGSAQHEIDDLAQGLGSAYPTNKAVHSITINNLQDFLKRAAERLATWLEEAEAAAKQQQLPPPSPLPPPFIWVHLVDGVNSLEEVASALCMHPVAVRIFSDLSPTSTLNVLNCESMAATDVCVFSKSEPFALGCQKFDWELTQTPLLVFVAHLPRFFYARRNLVVTMEMELMTKEAKTLNPWGESNSITGNPMSDDSQGSQNTMIFDLVQSRVANAAVLINQLGPGFLFYLMLSELHHQTSLIMAIYARTLMVLDRAVTPKAFKQRDALILLNDLHVLSSGLELLHYLFKDNSVAKGAGLVGGFSGTAATPSRRRESTLDQTADIAPLKGSINLSAVTENHDHDHSRARRFSWSSLMGDSTHNMPVIESAHAPFLQDMDDEMGWIHTSIERCEHILSGIRYNIGMSTNFRINQIQTGLAVTGTIFLPLQFLTGVFGMNFTNHKTGKYSKGLDILNQPHGAIWFWVMCVGSLVVQIGFIMWLLRTESQKADTAVRGRHYLRRAERERVHLARKAR